MSDPPTHYLLALFPGFQLLDVAGPLDILNLLTLTNPPTSHLTLTIIASTLDPVPVKPIPPLDPTTHTPKWTFPDFPPAATDTNTSFNQSIVPDVTFSSYLAASAAGEISPAGRHKPIDVLFIPGGLGTRVSRTDSATGETKSNVADLVEFVIRVAPSVRHSILTVCTGSAVLGATGLLDGRRATTNMSRFEQVVERAPGVRWLRGRRWVRSLASERGGEGKGYEGEIWTSAGISAGIDVMLAFVAEWYGGVEVAREAAKKLEYEWREIGEGEVDPMYGLGADGEEIARDGKVVDQS